jgi:S-DNA-T family DNA segregation ATPase FtsK/SpoIIIE
MVKEIARVAFYVIGAALTLAAFFLFVKVLWQITLRTSADRRREVLAFLFLILAVLLAISLLSYSAADYARTATRESIVNFGGVFGALAAHWLFRVMGYLAYTIPVALLAWAYNRMKGLQMTVLASRTVLAVALVVLVSLLLSIVPPPISPSGFKLAGQLGSSLASLSVRLLGRAGSYVVGLGLLVAVLSSEAAFRNAIRRSFSHVRRPRVRIRFVGSSTVKKTVRKRPERTAKKEPEQPVKPEPVSVAPQVAPRTVRPLLGETVDDSYQTEFLSILTDPPPFAPSETKDDLRRNSEMLEKKLLDYSIGGRVVNVSAGPVITRYEFEPAAGIKVSRVAGLADDLALAMKAERIRIVAPIPGKAAIGIEIPNKKRENVYLKDILVSDECAGSKSPLTVALGKNIAGEPTVSDVARMPHLLIAGATGSGKSVAINAMVASILYRASPGEVRFLMIDPKRLELPVYNGVPHQINPVVTEPKTSLDRLKEVIDWMDMRYREFAAAGVRDIEGYNSKMHSKKPYILIIVDELADLMITAPTEIEETLTRLAQMSRAVGIHLILATQRPSVDVITGLIKANFPARIAFQVASKTDSRTILDMNGAEKLLGRGDMLFLPPGKGEPVRIHGAYISTQEAKRIAQTWSQMHLLNLLRGVFPKEKAAEVVDVVMDEEVVDCIVDKRTPGRREALQSLARTIASKEMMEEEEAFALFDEMEYYPRLDEQVQTEKSGMRRSISGEGDTDELFEDAKSLVVRHQIASVSLLQRRLKIGYARAGRLIDQLEREGIVGPYSGSKAREVLVSEESEVPS